MAKEAKTSDNIIDKILTFGIRPLILTLAVILVGAALIAIGISTSNLGTALIGVLITVLGALLFVGFSSTVVVKKRPRFHAPQFMVGLEGEAKTSIKPGSEGIVLVASELWTATSRSKDEIHEGDKVAVIGYEGIKLVVTKPIEAKEQSQRA